MTWQLFILISVLFGSTSTLLKRVILIDDRSHPKAYSAFFQIFTGLLIGLFGFITTDMSYAGFQSILFNLALMILLYGFGNVFIFQALKALEASKFTIIFSTRVLFTILASTLILRERLLPQHLLGAILIFIGVLLVNDKSLKKLAFSKTEGIGLLAAASFGLANTNSRFILQTLDLYPFLFIAFVLPGVFIALIYPRIVGQMKVFLNKKIMSKMLIMSIVYALGAIAFFSSLKLAPTSSQVVSLNLTSVIVTVLLAIIFLKERKNLVQKLFAASVSFAGLLLVG
jgi:drug/metabolite transporter (DMT)-like permease